MAREYSFNDDDRPRWAPSTDPNPSLRPGDAHDAQVARDIGLVIGSEITSMPGNFLPVENRISTTTHYGDPSRAQALPADRAQEQRQQQAHLARTAEIASRLSGTSSLRQRPEMPGFVSSVGRDRTGRLVISWSRAHEQPDQEPD